MVTVAANRAHPRGALVRFEGVGDREAAESLRGAMLETERRTVMPAPAGSYYYFELAGCRCRDSRSASWGGSAR